MKSKWLLAVGMEFALIRGTPLIRRGVLFDRLDDVITCTTGNYARSLMV